MPISSSSTIPQAISLTPTVLKDPHRWLAETKVIVKPPEILLNKLVSNTYNHSVESVFEKALKGEKEKYKSIPLAINKINKKTCVLLLHRQLSAKIYLPFETL